jgi:hypothetical protein
MTTTIEQPPAARRAAYFIPAGTDVYISRRGSDFTPHVTQQPLQFEAPVIDTGDEMIFASGRWRILASRANVIMRRHIGQR